MPAKAFSPSLIEVEIAFRFAAALPPREHPYDAAETADAVPAELQQWMLLMLGHWMRNAEAASSDSLAPLPYIDSLIDPFVIWRFS